MSAVIANGQVYPDLSIAIKILVVDQGLESFEYEETTMGPLDTPTEPQIQGLLIEAMRKLNPSSDINEELFRLISDSARLQCATLASRIRQEAENYPTNISRESVKTWTRATAEVSVAGTPEEEE